MRDIIKSIENRILNAPDTVCLERARLATEGYKKFADLPVSIKRAKTLDHILANMTLDMDTNPVFAGNCTTAPHAWMLVPECGISVCSQIALEHTDLEHILDGAVPQDILDFWADKSTGSYGGIGHFSMDHDMLVNRGLESLIKQIDSTAGGTQAQQDYRQAMKISAEAVIKWAERYSAAAAEKATGTTDEKTRKLYTRISEACLHVPAKPARNFFEALQSVLLVHLALHIDGQALSVSIGLPDSFMARFTDEANSDIDAASELVAAFLLGVSANACQGRGSKTQAITIGGGYHDGSDRCNAITRCFLNAFEICPSISDPQLFLRWHKNIDPQIWQQAARLISAGRSMPLLVSDEVVPTGYMDMGVSQADAWDYCVIGCNELGIPGRCCVSCFSVGTGFDDLQVIDSVVRSSAESLRSIDDVLDAYESEVFKRATDGVKFRKKQIDNLAEKVPMTLSSACCQGCVEVGDDMLRAMPYNDIPGLFIRGTSNAINVLSVLDSRIFCGELPLADFISMVDSDSPEAEKIISSAPKWGCGNNWCDELAVQLNSRRTKALREAAKAAGVRALPVCHVVRSLHHLDGQRIGNTLDGRKAGQPVADSIGPVTGDNPYGPTALLNSVLKLSASKDFAGIYNLNITLAPSQAAPEVIMALSEGFFREGGQELQFNVLDVEKLRRAMNDPARHRDIVVRIAGLNARFVELSKREQEEIIQRAELAGCCV